MSDRYDEQHNHDTQFLVDDFFTFADQEDKGELVMVKMRGRQVPFYFKRGLSMVDRHAAQRAGISYKIGKNNRPEFSDVDDLAFSIEAIYRTLKSWPFKHSDGRKLPITRENIKSMFAVDADELAKIALSRTVMQPEQANFTNPSANS